MISAVEANIAAINVPSIFTLVVVLIMGVAIGYIMGERSGRTEEAARAAAVLKIVTPRMGWGGEQALREMNEEPELVRLERDGPYDDPRNQVPKDQNPPDNPKPYSSE